MTLHRSAIFVIVFSLSGAIGLPAQTTRSAAARDAAVVTRSALPRHDVIVRLRRLKESPAPVSFGLPLAPGLLDDPALVQVADVATGEAIAAVATRTLLSYYGTAPRPFIRALLIQFPSSSMRDAVMEVRVTLNGTPASLPGTVTEPFTATASVTGETTTVASRSIALTGGRYSLVERNVNVRTLYEGREPNVLATFPDDYLAGTGILGPQMARRDLLGHPELKGLVGFSDAFRAFTTSAMNRDGYALHPAAVQDGTNYEAWLYDRCDTFLTAYAHFGDNRDLAFAYRACSFYAAHINANGIFTVKPDADPKYSHLRGLFAYYALTGDESAALAARNIARMWQHDTYFVGPYEQGHTRGAEKLWTERLLAGSLEGLVYGFLFTGDPTYRSGADQLFETAYRHITTSNVEDLRAITLTRDAFPPQNCFVHSAVQQNEGNDDQAWCSIWMSELLIDPLIRYREVTGDARTDEVFLRLGRFMRDVGSQYFAADVVAGSSFADPQVCYIPSSGVDVRRLIPVYGAGVNAHGLTSRYAEYDDFNHCADASALAAAAIHAARQRHTWDLPYGAAGLRTEGESLTVLFHELASCAVLSFSEFSRTKRDPRNWTSDELREGYAGGDEARQAAWIAANKIGFPAYPTDPQRKLSWWFNTSMLEFRLLEGANVDVSRLRAGFIQPQHCATRPTPVPTPGVSTTKSPAAKFHVAGTL